MHRAIILYAIIPENRASIPPFITMSFLPLYNNIYLLLNIIMSVF